MNDLDLNEPIIGSGGGGKGGNSRTEAENTLRSNARARMVDLISEGEIVGLVDGAKSIYFDETPLQSAAGPLNFQGVSWQQRFGTPDQSHINGVPQVETPVSVEVKVTKNDPPPVRTILDQNADAVRVVIRIPSLMRTNNDDGSIEPTSVQYAIDVRPSGGSWTEMVNQTISNQKTNSPYQRAHRIELPAGGSPWDIRVRRITDDSTVLELQNDTYWEAYFILVEGKFTYPHSALVFLEVNAEDFGQQIPQRYYRVKGRKVKVPVNYNTTTRAYSGVWNGTFKTEWTNNPAWIFYDLITNDRFGLGEFIDAAKIDKWSLYQIAQYCDQLVPSGFKTSGGADIMEPRFTFNGVINTRDEAYNVLQSVINTWRGMAYWSIGQVFATADMPSDPVKLVAPANVIDGHFNYSGTAMKARHSVAIVQWNDPQDFYRPALEVVIDDEMLQRYGWRETEVQLPGCTSRGMAHRYGRWILDVERHETETIDYTASWDHADVRPGDIIAVADPNKASVRTGGRIVGIEGGTTVVLDGLFTPGSGATYQLMVEMPDASIQTRAITSFNQTGGVQRVVIASGFTQTPVSGAMWVITGTDVVPRQYRVISIVEDQPNLFKVTALFHDPNKYARVEDGVLLPDLPYTRPTNIVKPPTNLTATESLFYENGVPKTRVLLSWTPADDFMSRTFQVSMDTPNGSNVQLGQTTNTSMDINDVKVGTYTFYVTAIGYSGRTSLPATLTYNVGGWETNPQPYVINLALRGGGTTFSGSSPEISWVNVFPGLATGVSPFYLDNQIQVYDATFGNLLRTEYVRGQSYVYDIAKNRQDNAAVGRTGSRALRFEVAVRDTFSRTSPEAVLTINNPQAVLAGTTQVPGIGNVHVRWNRPTDSDFAGVRVWLSTTSGFNPNTTTPVYDGSDNSTTLPATPGTTYYLRAGAYDAFGIDGMTILPEVTVMSADITVDTEAPATPTGLTLSSASTVNGSGTVVTTVIANWDDNTEADLAYYDVQIRAGLGNYVSFQTTTSEYSWPVTPGTSYTVRVRAFDHAGNVSAFTATQSITAVADTIAPAVPAGFTLTPGFTTIWLKWNNNTEADLARYEIYMSTSTTTPAVGATPTYITRANTLTVQELTDNATRNFWIRAVDTSGNRSAWSARISGQTSGPIDEVRIADGAIEAKVATIGTAFIEDAHIVELNASKISVGELNPAILVGASGVQIGDLSDPIGIINSGTTLIEPGKIQISGATTLADWKGGGDDTKINGGAIEANSIAANSLKIGARGITVTGIDFSAVSATNTVSWTAGSIGYFNDAGVLTEAIIAGGSAVWTTGNLYLYWVKDAAVIAATEDPAIAVSADTIVLATYSGLAGLRVTYGGTIIDGSRIVANSISATQIAAESITGDRIAAGTITGDLIAANTISSSRLVITGISENLVVNSDFEEDLADNWVQTSITGTGGTFFRQAGGVTGTQRLVIRKGGTTTANGLGVRSSNFDVLPNTVYEYAFYAWSTGTSAAGLFARVRWYDAASVAISSVDIVSDGNFNSTPTRFAGQVTAPANARYARLEIYNWHNSTRNDLYIDAVSFRRAAKATLIENGAIETDKLSASAVTADKIATNAITAAKVAAGAITADKIGANAITAVKISAGSVETDKIVINGVTTDRIQDNAVTESVAVFTSGNTTLGPSSGANQNVQSATITGVSGKPIFVNFALDQVVTLNAGLGTVSGDITIRLRRTTGGSTVDVDTIIIPYASENNESIPVTKRNYSFVESPGAGNHTYTVNVAVNTIDGSITVVTSRRLLYATLAKR